MLPLQYPAPYYSLGLNHSNSAAPINKPITYIVIALPIIRSSVFGRMACGYTTMSLYSHTTNARYTIKKGVKKIAF